VADAPEEVSVVDTGTITPVDVGTVTDTAEPSAPAADASTMDGSACALGHATDGSWVALLAVLGLWRRSAQHRRSRSP
jgi:hypothetical protein